MKTAKKEVTADEIVEAVRQTRRDVLEELALDPEEAAPSVLADAVCELEVMAEALEFVDGPAYALALQSIIRRLKLVYSELLHQSQEQRKLARAGQVLSMVKS